MYVIFNNAAKRYTAEQCLHTVMELREVDSEDSGGETADEEHCSDDNDNIVVVDDESNDSTDSESEEEIPPVRKRMKLLHVDKHPILAVSPTVKATCRHHDTHASFV